MAFREVEFKWKPGSPASAICSRSQGWTVIDGLPLVRVFQRFGRVEK